MRNLDFYEFTGVLAPGVTLLTGTAFLLGDGASAFWVAIEGIGGAAFLTVVAYVVGHLTQAFGNLLEKAWWTLHQGQPTDWIRTGRGKLLAAEQKVRLCEVTGVKMEELSKLGRKEWFSITRELFTQVKNRDRQGRIERFNGNYGMFRGIATAFALLFAFAYPISGTWDWVVQGTLFGLFILALLRMHRFGKYYARELFLEGIQLLHGDSD